MSGPNVGGGSSERPPPPRPQVKKPPVKREAPPRPVEAKAKPVKDQTKPGQTPAASGPAAGSPKPTRAGKANAAAGNRPPPPASGQATDVPKPAPPGKANASQAVSAKAPTTAIHLPADPAAVRQLLNELAKRGTSGGSALSELAALRAQHPFEQVLCREDGSIATVFGRTIWLFHGNQIVDRALRTYSSVEAPSPHSTPAVQFRVGADGEPQLLSPDDRGPVDATLSPNAYDTYRFLRDSDVTEGESVGAITTGVMLQLGVEYEAAIAVGRAIGGIVGAHYGIESGGGGEGQQSSSKPEVQVVERVTPERARPEDAPTESVRSPSTAVPEIQPDPEPVSAISAEASQPVSELAPPWARLAARAEKPQARKSTGGFRSQPADRGTLHGDDSRRTSRRTDRPDRQPSPRELDIARRARHSRRRHADRREPSGGRYLGPGSPQSGPAEGSGECHPRGLRRGKGDRWSSGDPHPSTDRNPISRRERCPRPPRRREAVLDRHAWHRQDVSVRPLCGICRSRYPLGDCATDGYTQARQIAASTIVVPGHEKHPRH